MIDPQQLRDKAAPVRKLAITPGRGRVHRSNPYLLALAERLEGEALGLERMRASDKPAIKAPAKPNMMRGHPRAAKSRRV
jgi:hypothetical protein